MLTHPSSYGGFIADTLGLTRNRTRHAPPPDAPPGAVGEAVDLDGRQDPFWAAQAAAALPEAIEANDTQLRAVVAEETELRRRAGSGGDAGGDLSTAGLASAMDGLPALLKRKAQLQTHTRLLQALMNVRAVLQLDAPAFALAHTPFSIPDRHFTGGTAVLQRRGQPHPSRPHAATGCAGGGGGSGDSGEQGLFLGSGGLEHSGQGQGDILGPCSGNCHVLAQPRPQAPGMWPPIHPGSGSTPGDVAPL